ncbi:xylose isomerase-like protein [Daldinia grandis]|nr:xylose isomerase-like protein [Daldinia grandis]
MHPSPIEHFSPAVVSTSLGDPTVYSIRSKIEQAVINGFIGIEISFDEDDLFAAAERIANLCQVLGLNIIAFGPFQRYEGLRDRVRHNGMKHIIKIQFLLARALGTDTVIFTANHLPQNELSEGFILEDLRLLSQWGLDLGINIAYTFTCYSTVVNKWWKAWEVVKLVNSPNFGLCLSTFHIAGALSDDTSALPYKGSEASIRHTNSINRMIKTVLPSKIFRLHVSSAVPFIGSLSVNHPWYNPHETPYMSWSRHGKGFLFENNLGGRYSMEDLTRCIVLGLGYTGYISMESSTPGGEKGPFVPAEYAFRAKMAWVNFQIMLKLTRTPSP